MMPKTICGPMLAFLAAFSVAGWSEVAHADAADYEVPRQVVKFADLNVDSVMGATSLYHRIESAAERVCGGSRDTRELSRAAPFNACKAQAIGRAVDAVHSSGLTSLYLTKAGRSGKSLRVAMAP